MKNKKSKKVNDGWKLKNGLYEYNVVNGVVEEVAIEGKIFVATKKQTRRDYYHDIFKALSTVGMNDKRIPKKLLESWDNVADYFGDVAMGRRK